MKQILLLLLTCGIYVSASAQIDPMAKTKPGDSDKWEIIKGNTKNAKSKLFVSLPKDAHWDMTIYAAGSNKVLSNTLLKNEFLLLPGSYDVEVNKIRITGVRVEKGNNTRLKAGVLHVTTPDSWTLYDETKQTVLINTYSAQSRGLPVGKYILTINGQEQIIKIKDEGAQENVQIMETDTWSIKPLNPIMAQGRLNLSFGSATWNVYIFGNGIHKSITSSDGLNHYDLSPGEYFVQLNAFTVEKIPIRQGHETRIKHGFIEVLTECDYILNFGPSPDIRDKGPKKFVSPVGTGITFCTSNVGGYRHGMQTFIIRNGVTDSTKVGILNVASGNWVLKNVAGETCVNSSSTGSSVVLAIGDYILRIGSTNHSIKIYGGDTLEY